MHWPFEKHVRTLPGSFGATSSVVLTVTGSTVFTVAAVTLTFTVTFLFQFGTVPFTVNELALRVLYLDAS